MWISHENGTALGGRQVRRKKGKERKKKKEEAWKSRAETASAQSRRRPLYNSSAHPRRACGRNLADSQIRWPGGRRNHASVVFHSGRRPPHATSIYSTPPLAFSARKLLWISGSERRDERNARRGPGRKTREEKKKRRRLGRRGRARARVRNRVIMLMKRRILITANVSLARSRRCCANSRYQRA